MMGAALNGKSVGGRAYGYRSEPIGGSDGKVTGAKILIDEEQARWIQKIFKWYDDGKSPRWIAGGAEPAGRPLPRRHLEAQDPPTRRQVAQFHYLWRLAAPERHSSQ